MRSRAFVRRDDQAARLTQRLRRRLVGGQPRHCPAPGRQAPAHLGLPGGQARGFRRGQAACPYQAGQLAQAVAYRGIGLNAEFVQPLQHAQRPGQGDGLGRRRGDAAVGRPAGEYQHDPAARPAGDVYPGLADQRAAPHHVHEAGGATGPFGQLIRAHRGQGHPDLPGPGVRPASSGGPVPGHVRMLAARRPRRATPGRPQPAVDRSPRGGQHRFPPQLAGQIVPLAAGHSRSDGGDPFQHGHERLPVPAAEREDVRACGWTPCSSGNPSAHSSPEAVGAPQALTART